MSLNPKTFEQALATHKPLSRKKGLRASGFPRKPVSTSEGLKASGRGTGLKRGTRLRPLGKKGKAWIDVRRVIKQWFEWAGITICEFRFSGCYYDASGGFAHCRKRRLLLEGEIWHVGLSCLHCHTILDERLTHEAMHNEVHKVIEKRGGILAPPAILQQVQSDSHAS